MKNRESGVDLLRCMGLLLVNCVHSFLYNGFYSQPQTGVAMWITNSFFWIFYGCNGVFMTLHGYLKCDKPLNAKYYRSLLPVLVGYLLTCVVSFPIRHFLIGEKLTIVEWLTKMVTFDNYGWYVEMYIGLLLLSPIINLALERLSKRKELLWLAGTMVVVTSLNSITSLDLIPDYWTAMYPLTYYVLGAVIKKLQPRIKPWICLSAMGASAMLMGLFTLISTDAHFTDGFRQGYGGFWVMLIVVFLFLGVYKLRIRPKVGKVLSWLAGGVFEGYILSRLLDVWVYKLAPSWHTPTRFPLIFMYITIPVFVISILSGKVLHTVAMRLCRTSGKKQLQKTK